jgi:hypothetical protein
MTLQRIDLPGRRHHPDLHALAMGAPVGVVHVHLVEVVLPLAPVGHGDAAGAIHEGRHDDGIATVGEGPEGAEELNNVHVALPLLGRHMVGDARKGVIQDKAWP